MNTKLSAAALLAHPKQTSTLLALLAPGLLASLATGQTDIVENGDFEVNGGHASSTAPPWVFTGNVQTNNACCLPWDSDGVGTTTVAWNGGNNPPNGTLSQELTTTPGVTYQLSFDFSKFGAAPDGTASLDVMVFDGPGIVGAQLLNENVFYDGPGTFDPIDYVSYSFSFQAQSSTTTLHFVDTSFGGFNDEGTVSFDPVLDNVAVMLPIGTVIDNGTGVNSLCYTPLNSANIGGQWLSWQEENASATRYLIGTTRPFSYFWPGGELLVDPYAYALFVGSDAGPGGTMWTVPIPNNPAWVGFQGHFQALYYSQFAWSACNKIVVTLQP